MAARQKGSFSLGGTLEILADAPADARLCVKTKSELTDANSYPYKYVGMIVSVADEGKAYILTAADTTIASNWKELGEGGGGGGGTAGSVYTGTLLASGWNSTTKQQTLTFTDYSADYHGVVGLPADATKAQVEAYRDAIIRTVSQSGATVTFECEEIPSINLPVEIYCGGGSGSAEFPSGGTTGQALVKKSNADNDVEWGDVGGEAFIVTITMNGGGNLVADKTPKQLEDAIADNAIVKAKLPMYGLVLNLSVASSGNYAFSTFYTEDATDPSTTAFGTILMVKDTDSAWDSITMQTFQGDKLQRSMVIGSSSLNEPELDLKDFDYENDSTNDKDIISSHRLTSAEMADIMSTLPGTPTTLPILFDGTGVERVVGWYKLANGTKKPVYQTDIEYTNDISITTTVSTVDIANVTSLNIDKLVSLQGVGGNNTMFPSCSILSSVEVSRELYLENNYIRVRTYRTNGSITISGVRIYLQYTKTTDTPV